MNDTQCTIEEIKKVITNVFYVNHVDYATDDAKVLGLVSKFEKLGIPYFLHLASSLYCMEFSCSSVLLRMIL